MLTMLTRCGPKAIIRRTGKDVFVWLVEELCLQTEYSTLHSSASKIVFLDSMTEHFNSWVLSKALCLKFTHDSENQRFQGGYVTLQVFSHQKLTAFSHCLSHPTITFFREYSDQNRACSK
jgi:hypothetical protein